MGLLPLATATTAGLALIIAAESMLLLCAGAFNPAFATYRMHVTDDRYLSRVIAAWAITNKIAQPALIAASGVLATMTSPRTAVAALAVLLLTSAAFLPWRVR
jgi:uncharacterized membrane protein YbaN (DUF454 family)